MTQILNENFSIKRIQANSPVSLQTTTQFANDLHVSIPSFIPSKRGLYLNVPFYPSDIPIIIKLYPNLRSVGFYNNVKNPPTESGYTELINFIELLLKTYPRLHLRIFTRYFKGSLRFSPRITIASIFPEFDDAEYEITSIFE